jgi:hypothetical protein
MVATARAALLGSLVSIVAAQSVNLFIPEYEQEDTVAQIVGEVWMESFSEQHVHHVQAVVLMIFI